MWVQSFEWEGGSCDLALNHPGIRLQLDWDVSEDECFGKIWKTLGTRPAICLGKDAHVVSWGRGITLETSPADSLHNPLGRDVNI